MRNFRMVVNTEGRKGGDGAGRKARKGAHVSEAGQTLLAVWPVPN